MEIVKDKIEISELKEMSKKMFDNLVKAAVDIEKEVVAVDAPLHADLMELLIEKINSDPKDVWGFNIYPDNQENNFIEFDSMINLKPTLGNRTRGIESEEIKKRIVQIVNKLIIK